MSKNISHNVDWWNEKKAYIEDLPPEATPSKSDRRILSDLLVFSRIQPDLVWLDRICSDLVGFGWIQSDLVGFVQILLDLARFGRIWSEWSDLVRVVRFAQIL